MPAIVLQRDRGTTSRCLDGQELCQPIGVEGHNARADPQQPFMHADPSGEPSCQTGGCEILCPPLSLLPQQPLGQR